MSGFSPQRVLLLSGGYLSGGNGRFGCRRSKLVTPALPLEEPEADFGGGTPEALKRKRLSILETTVISASPEWLDARSHIVNLLSGDLSASGVILAHGHSERLRLVWDIDPSRLDRSGPFSTLLLRLTPEAVWDWLELGDGDGTPRSQSGGVREQPAKMGSIQSALLRTTRFLEFGQEAPGAGEIVGAIRHCRGVPSRELDYSPESRLGMGDPKTYGIRKKLDRDLVQQEDALNALQHQIDNGDALENESRVVRSRIGALWNRLDSYVRKDF
ncbi:hypothetical protein NDU88_010375 [Pleurodeles waltl]|uniref:Uncharacterized protein n=1 Tax=Pleurodeles waltl TaxID=8319 RepID=A0AAV7RY18_PLEWA|nr:hypothetical protein NDU88_010375 [Pleurodeles waltl]